MSKEVNSLQTSENSCVTSRNSLGEEKFFLDPEEEKLWAFNFPHRINGSEVAKNNEREIRKCVAESKTSDAEVQCDISEMNLIDIINRYSSLSDNVNNDFEELINLCKHLSRKYADKIGEHNDSSSCNKEPIPDVISAMKTPIVRADSDEFLPSRHGISKYGDKFLSNSFQTEGSVSREDNFSLSKVGRTKKTRKPENIRKSARLSKPLRERKIDTGKLVTNKRKYLQYLKTQNRKISDIEVEQQNKSSANKEVKKFFLGREKDNTEEDVHVNVKLPKQFIRPLARHWMKPNKTLHCELLAHEHVNVPQEFKSFQYNKKLRRLYSPDTWLNSEEFAKMSEPDEKARQSIQLKN